MILLDYNLSQLVEYFKDIPKYISPFSAITSENWNESIIQAINMDEKDVTLPMEKIMMGQ